MESNFDCITEIIHFYVKTKYFIWYLDLCLHKIDKFIHKMFYSDIYFFQEKKIQF